MGITVCSKLSEMQGLYIVNRGAGTVAVTVVCSQSPRTSGAILLHTGGGLSPALCEGPGRFVSHGRSDLNCATHHGGSGFRV